MEFNFSEKIKSVKPSVIREILKQMGDPSLISFAGGNPAPESFPIDEIRKFSDKLLTEEPVSTLQYSITEGYPPFRKAVEDFANKSFTIKKPDDELIITSGSQQIIDFAARCLCNEGDIVVCEELAFLGALNTIKSYGAKLSGVPNDQTGSIDLAKLEQVFAGTKKPKFFYVIPNFHNPTGLTMPLEKRKSVYELAIKYNILVLEDDPYGQLRYTGEHIPPIKSFDQNGAVLYAGSFSKIMCPGMRMAYAIGAKQLVEKLVIAKQCCDVHSNVWAQKVCCEILTKTDMDKHLEKLQSIYREKAMLMVAEMQKTFSKKVVFTKPQGGMFIWVTMPDGVDVNAFIQEALSKKVAVVPGAAFLADESKPCQSFRANFSTADKANIIKGIAVLGELTKKYCD